MIVSPCLTVRASIPPGLGRALGGLQPGPETRVVCLPGLVTVPGMSLVQPGCLVSFVYCPSWSGNIFTSGFVYQWFAVPGPARPLPCHSAVLLVLALFFGLVLFPVPLLSSSCGLQGLLGQCSVVGSYCVALTETV